MLSGNLIRKKSAVTGDGAISFGEIGSRSGEQKKREFLWSIVSACLVLAAIGNYWFSLLDLNVNGVIVLVAGFLVVIASQWVWFFARRKWIWPVGLAGGIVLLLLVFLSYWKNGYALAVNACISLWQKVVPMQYTVYYVDPDRSASASLVVFLLLLVALLALFFAYIIRSGSVLLTVLICLVQGGAEVVFGSFQKPWASVFVYLALGFLIAETIFQKHALQGFAGISLMLLVPALLLGGLFLVSAWHNMEKPKAFQEAQEKTEKKISVWRYGENHDGLTDGDFTGLDYLDRSDHTVLEVTMDYPSSYYLKGFVGSEYVTNGWKAPKAGTVSQDSDLFYWLHNNGLSGFTQLSTVALLTDTTDTDTKQQVQLSVKNVDASRKYLYVPYELLNTPMASRQIGDYSMLTEGLHGQDSYSMRALSNQVKYSQALAAGLILKEKDEDPTVLTYLDNEAHYNRLAYRDNLDVPEDLQDLFSSIFKNSQIKKGESHLDYVEAKQNISYYLSTEMKETGEIDPYSGKEDFVYDFLINEKQGYDVHFASAAVMMFRYFGIPARYVEGYLITKDTAAEAKAGEPVAVQGTEAHAWAEYYHDGIGWVPFESTPSYLNKMEQPEEYKSLSILASKYQEELKRQKEQKEQEAGKPDDNQDMEQNKDDSIFNKEHMKIWIFWLILLLILLLLIAWVVRYMRIRNRRRLAEDPDPFTGICGVYAYVDELLSRYGIKASALPGGRADGLARVFSEDCARAYQDFVEIRQEAVYSTHTMSPDQRDQARAFRHLILSQVKEKSGTLQWLKYRYWYYF